MKILLLTDGQGWVVDRIATKYKDGIPFDIDIDYYTKISEEQLLEKSKDYDIVHFNNADVGRHMDFIESHTKPTIMSVRSFRFKQPALDASKHVIVHVIHPDMKKLFPNAFYISDAVDDIFQPKKFVVGIAYQDASWNIDYKGVDLVRQACKELNLELREGTNLSIDEMPKWYDSIDLYVCASKNEGFGTPVLECLVLNKPVITTDVGIGKYTTALKVDRTVDGIKQGILHYYTYTQVEKFRWSVVCEAMRKFYEEIYDNSQR